MCVNGSVALLALLYFVYLCGKQGASTINVHEFSCKNVCYFCPILTELEFFVQIVLKTSSIKFIKNHTLGTKLFHVHKQIES
jgi:hypothetical protein